MMKIGDAGIFPVYYSLNISVQYNGGLLPDMDPRLLPSGNPFKYHVVTLSLQPT